MICRRGSRFYKVPKLGSPLSSESSTGLYHLSSIQPVAVKQSPSSEVLSKALHSCGEGNYLMLSISSNVFLMSTEMLQKAPVHATHH